MDETPHPGETPEALALRLSVAKAQAVVSAHPGCVVIGSDQVATVDGQPIGKPEISSAPGSTAGAGRPDRRIPQRAGRYRRRADRKGGYRHPLPLPPLSDQAIDAYLRAEEPYDTAGSAKAESLGIALMESIQSDDPTAIIGCP